VLRLDCKSRAGGFFYDNGAGNQVMRGAIGFAHKLRDMSVFSVFLIVLERGLRYNGAGRYEAELVNEGLRK
jgi:hypothetical protein